MADYKFLDADGLQAVWSIIDAEKVGKKERRVSDNSPLGEVFNTYSTNSWEANTASAAGSHAEGQHTTASGQAAHAQGIDTVASGIASHAGGQNTLANGNYAMAIGQGTEASSGGSLAMGVGTWTDSADGALALGRYNKKDVYNFLIAAGNGSGDQARSNAFTVYQNGNTEIAGTLTVTGAGTFSSNLSVTGTVTASSISMMQSGIATPLSSIFVSQVAGKGLSTEDFTTAHKTALDDYMNNNYGSLLSDVQTLDDYQSDGYVSTSSEKLVNAGYVNEFITDATSGFVEEVSGKGLSTNDFTNAYKSLLDTYNSSYVNSLDTYVANYESILADIKDSDDYASNYSSQFDGKLITADYLNSALNDKILYHLNDSDFVTEGGYQSGNSDDPITAGYLNEYITNATYGKLGSANVLNGTYANNYVASTQQNKLVTASYVQVKANTLISRISSLENASTGKDSGNMLQPGYEQWYEGDDYSGIRQDDHYIPIISGEGYLYPNKNWRIYFRTEPGNQVEFTICDNNKNACGGSIIKTADSYGIIDFAVTFGNPQQYPPMWINTTNEDDDYNYEMYYLKFKLSVNNLFSSSQVYEYAFYDSNSYYLSDVNTFDGGVYAGNKVNNLIKQLQFPFKRLFGISSSTFENQGYYNEGQFSNYNELNEMGIYAIYDVEYPDNSPIFNSEDVIIAPGEQVLLIVFPPLSMLLTQVMIVEDVIYIRKLYYNDTNNAWSSSTGWKKITTTSAS